MQFKCLVALGVLFALGSSLDAQERARPNVLFLFADDQRPDAVGAFGNPDITTPHLDRLVRDGFRFRRNYCMGSIHGAVCQPSRAMVMSGRTLYRVPMDLANVETLPRVLAANGYTTFMTGKWHNGGDALKRSFQRGRNLFLGGMSDHTRVPLRELDEHGGFVNEHTGERFSSELFADAAIEFISSQAEREDRAPFFAYVAFTAPHDPRQPPEPYRSKCYESRPPLPTNFMPQHPFHNGWMTGRDEKLAAWPRTEDVIRDQLAEYYGLIAHMDAQIGRILAALRAHELANETIVVFAADHGLALGSHGLLGKQSVYEHSLGCPLVFAGPGIPRGASDALTYLFDIFPTLIELTGSALPQDVEGRSLVPVWNGERETVRDSIYLAYEDKMRAVVRPRFKLIRYPLIDHEQLFDLEADPHELVNLAGEAAYTEQLDALRAELVTWHARVDDPHPLVVDVPQSMEIDLSGRARKPDAHQPKWVREKYFD